MIDNRPKVHRPKKVPPDYKTVLQAEKLADVHSSSIHKAPVPVIEAPVKAKAVPAMPTAGGPGGILGSLGNLGILPVVLIISALQKNNGLPFGQQSRPAPKQLALPAVPAEPISAASAQDNKKPLRKKAPEPTVKAAALPQTQPPKAEAATGQKQRNQLRAYKKPPEITKEPEPEHAPAPVSAPSTIRPPRPQPRPADIKNLLSDLSGYLPGTGSASAARISKIMGIADELRSMDSSGSVYASSLQANPMDRNIGVLNALSRHLPMSGASNLGRASQVLSLVNTIKGSGGGGQNMGNMAGMLSGMMGGQNMGNMAGMLSGMMGGQNQQQSQEMKNVTPAQADGLKDTVNRLLSGMDDKQKSELLDKAKDFLGKSKK